VPPEQLVAPPLTPPRKQVTRSLLSLVPQASICIPEKD
jgi:hypothetical protein